MNEPSMNWIQLPREYVTLKSDLHVTALLQPKYVIFTGW